MQLLLLETILDVSVADVRLTLLLTALHISIAVILSFYSSEVPSKT